MLDGTIITIFLKKPAFSFTTISKVTSKSRIKNCISQMFFNLNKNLVISSNSERTNISRLFGRHFNLYFNWIFISSSIHLHHSLSTVVLSVFYFEIKFSCENYLNHIKMREIVHIQAGQCGNQIGAKVRLVVFLKITNKWKTGINFGLPLFAGSLRWKGILL